MNTTISLSIVVPVYSGSDYLSDLCEQIHILRQDLIPCSVNLQQLIFVCDDPIDDSISHIKRLANTYEFIEYFDLAFNVGQHQATAAGCLSSRSHWTVTLDEDLQHKPYLIPTMLFHAISNNLDVIYMKSTIPVHASSFYRDLASFLSKKLIRFFSDSNLSNTSSFRLVRSELAKATSVCMDSNTYFNVLLHRVSSFKRRATLNFPFNDPRPQSSGYDFFSLFRHFKRFAFSSNLSYLRIALLFGLIILFISLLIFVFVLSSYFNGASSLSPGWSSLYIGIVFAILVNTFCFAFLLQVVHRLLSRITNVAPFIVMDRSIPDKDIFLDKLSSLVMFDCF